MHKKELTGQLTTNEKTIMNTQNIPASSQGESFPCVNFPPRIQSAACGAKLQALKNSLVEKFTSEFSDVHPHLVQQAVNEADALATWAGIPHLLLPALAEEKVRNARNWSLHQRTVFERSRLALAA